MRSHPALLEMYTGRHHVLMNKHGVSYLPTYNTNLFDKKEKVSWHAAGYSVLFSLAVVVGVSYAMSVVQEHMIGERYPDSDRVVALAFEKAVSPKVAVAATTGSSLDRSAYYSANWDVYAQASVKPSVTTNKAFRVKKSTAVKPTAVAKPVVAAQPVSMKAVPQPAAVATVSAFKLIQSDRSLAIGQKQDAIFEVGYKNNGAVAWKKSENFVLKSSAAKESYFADSTWINGNTIVKLDRDVLPGEVAYLRFTLEAPSAIGSYTEKMALYMGTTKIADTDVVLPIVVSKYTKPVQIASIAPVLDTKKPSSPVVHTASTDGAPAVATVDPVAPVVTPSANGGTVATVNGVTMQFAPVTGVVNAIKQVEPQVRIGLTYTKEPVQITANKKYDIRDGSGSIVATEEAGVVSTIVFDFATKVYTLSTPTTTATSTTYYRFTGAGVAKPADDSETVFEILSFTNRPGWTTALNDNKYRSALEVRYAQKTDRLWIINELSLENYLRGIAETSNNSPYEYQKALIIAARTYAQIHINSDGRKYAGENFTMRSTDYDQVYRGYGSEIRMPNVVRAVKETRGVMVTLNGAIVVTPYYSQSDGRTRSWEEVWAGGPKSWLKAVPDPYCTGMKLLGHGIGMSAIGALRMASDGRVVEEILKYYYTGIELTKFYN